MSPGSKPCLLDGELTQALFWVYDNRWRNRWFPSEKHPTFDDFEEALEAGVEASVCVCVWVLGLFVTIAVA